jgi:hypothetical protein
MSGASNSNGGERGEKRPPARDGEDGQEGWKRQRSLKGFTCQKSIEEIIMETQYPERVNLPKDASSSMNHQTTPLGELQRFVAIVVPFLRPFLLERGVCEMIIGYMGVPNYQRPRYGSVYAGGIDGNLEHFEALFNTPFIGREMMGNWQVVYELARLFWKHLNLNFIMYKGDFTWSSILGDVFLTSKSPTKQYFVKIKFNEITRKYIPILLGKVYDICYLPPQDDDSVDRYKKVGILKTVVTRVLSKERCIEREFDRMCVIYATFMKIASEEKLAIFIKWLYSMYEDDNKCEESGYDIGDEDYECKFEFEDEDEEKSR